MFGFLDVWRVVFEFWWCATKPFIILAKPENQTNPFQQSINPYFLISRFWDCFLFFCRFASDTLRILTTNNKSKIPFPNSTKKNHEYRFLHFWILNVDLFDCWLCAAKPFRIRTNPKQIQKPIPPNKNLRVGFLDSIFDVLQICIGALRILTNPNTSEIS